MRTAATIKLLPAEMSMIRRSTKLLSDHLTGWNKKLFDATTLKRVNDSTGTLVMDGMELKDVARALRKQGWFFYNSGLKTESKIYFELAQWIREQRVQFQEENGPKIKTAISGETLTAAIV